MICPIQLLRPAKKPMAGPSSCKGQNKVGDNFKIGAQRVNVLVSSMWLLPTQEALVYMMSMRMNKFCVWFSLQKIISVGYCPHVPMGWLLPTQAALVYITLPSLLGM